MPPRLLIAAALLVLAGAGCAPGSWPGAFEVRHPFGGATDVPLGSSALFEDGLRLTLKQLDDSRCPKGVTCVWQGELSGVFDASGGALAAKEELRLGMVSGAQAEVGPYRVALSDASDTTFTVVVDLIAP